jgi:hypothetical protein
LSTQFVRLLISRNGRRRRGVHARRMWDAKTIRDIAEWAIEQYGSGAAEQIGKRAEQQRALRNADAERDWLGVLQRIRELQRSGKNGH